MITHFHKLTPPLKSGLVATIGSFDGVHVGHRAILRQMTDLAHSKNMESAVISFDPHPRLVIEGENSNLKLLSSLEEKQYLLSKVGIDHLIILKFDKSLQQLTAEQFTNQILISDLGVKLLLVGYNNHIGSDRQLSMKFLENHPIIESIVIPKVDIDSEKISSTIIREEILNGDMQKAALHLGNPYIFIAKINPLGEVETILNNKLIPKDGIYQCKINSLDAELIIAHNKLKITRLLPNRVDYNASHLIEIYR